MYGLPVIQMVGADRGFISHGECYDRSMWEGTVVSIHIAREAAATMQSIAEVRALPGLGLARITLGLYAHVVPQSQRDAIEELADAISPSQLLTQAWIADSA